MDSEAGVAVRVVLVASDPRVRAAVGAILALHPDLDVVAETGVVAVAADLAVGPPPAAVLVDANLLASAAGQHLAGTLQRTGGTLIAFSSTSVPPALSGRAPASVIYADTPGDIEAALALLRSASRPEIR